jgi:hypothetical protein
VANIRQRSSAIDLIWPLTIAARARFLGLVLEPFDGDL